MTAKLTDTQLIVLSRACAHDDRVVLPLPDSLKGGAVGKVVNSLLGKGLVAEAEAQPGQPRWREEDGIAIMLVATDAAFKALGIELPDTVEPDHSTAPVAPAPRTRANTKLSQLIAMLEKGATVDEIATTTGWQKHTVRGAMAGALKKKLGLTITSEKVEGRGRVYHIAE